MAVPAEIRAVPRPVNTIVDDSGTNSPKRYAVRQRASSKYIPGGNPQPKNGKVIGHIIDYKYVPLTDNTASDFRRSDCELPVSHRTATLSCIYADQSGSIRICTDFSRFRSQSRPSVIPGILPR